MERSPICSFTSPFRFAIVLLGVLMTVLSAGAATITYLPDYSRTSLMNEIGVSPSSQIIFRELPSGVVVVDRIDQIDWSAFADPIAPQLENGAWFLVDTSRGPQCDLSQFGIVHLRDGSLALIEVPGASLREFVTLPLAKEYLDLTAPPANAAAYATEVRLAAGALAELPERLAPPVEEYLALGSETEFLEVLSQISGGSDFDYDGENHTIVSRHVEHPDKTLMGNYLSEILNSYGYTVTFEDFNAWGAPCRNIVATRIGITTPAEYVIVGGHYDSTSQNPSVSAPGAEDNGSGTALVMEIARLSATVEFERTVQFVLFDAEEWGLLGSEYFVEQAIAGGRTIIAAITADMVSYYDNDYGVLIEGETDWEWLMTVMENSVNAYTGLASDKAYNSWGSDHVSFQNAGIPAFLAIDLDWDSYPYYHTIDDTWANVEATAAIGHEIAQACAATLADVAGLYSLSSAVAERLEPWRLRLSASPNPIQDRGVIRFNLPRSERGTLSLLDLSGRRIATLADRQFAEGAHDVQIKSVGDDGQELPGGIYYYRLQTDSVAQTRKLVIVR